MAAENCCCHPDPDSEQREEEGEGSKRLVLAFSCSEEKQMGAEFRSDRVLRISG